MSVPTFPVSLALAVLELVLLLLLLLPCRNYASLTTGGSGGLRRLVASLGLSAVASQPALDCVGGLLTADPRERLSVEAALAHPWFSGERRAAVAATGPPVTPPGTLAAAAIGLKSASREAY